MVCNIGTAGRKDQNRSQYETYNKTWSASAQSKSIDVKHLSKLANDYWKERDNRGGK